MNGASRYDVKAAAGMDRTRADGSQYSRTVDAVAGSAEEWFADLTGGVLDDSVRLRGDQGYDVVVTRRGVLIRCDVVHAGTLPDGTPRPGLGSCLIVNPDSNKLLRSDLLVLVAGPPFAIVGAMYTTRFLALCRDRDHGNGAKYSLPAVRLEPITRFIHPLRGHR